MAYVLAFIIAIFAGWWAAAIDSLFRADERPGLFGGTPGMVLLLIAAAAGGLLVAGAVIWVARVVPSASVALIIAIGSILGFKASNLLHVNAAGAANRMLLGLAGLTVLYGVAWRFFPVS
jgi:hypothetical protein